jgi:hypothetical protein
MIVQTSDNDCDNSHPILQIIYLESIQSERNKNIWGMNHNADSQIK